ncbi:glycosyltransferase family 2 protein [Flaviramulus basaltis]|nr:glycosyltransferase [Flaviramulus basaltis]
MVELSVHLITFNNEKHIKETLDSILKQKVDFKFEIIVGDDCSNDNTLKIINTYKEQYPNLINVTKNKTQLGLLKNFKATLDRCNGKYIFDIAGDDLLKCTNTLQTMVDALKKDNTLGFIDSGFDLFLETQGKIIPFANKKTIYASNENYKKQLLLGKLTPIGICFNKALLNKFVDFKTYIDMNITIEDYPILVDLAVNTNFKSITKSLHIYRVHDTSYSHKKTFEQHYFLLNQMKILFDYFSIKYSYCNEVTTNFKKDFNKQLLYLSGYYGKKKTGKKAFITITSKSIKDYIYFFASQNNLFKKTAFYLKRKIL